jgi:hypothetical protein
MDVGAAMPMTRLSATARELQKRMIEGASDYCHCELEIISASIVADLPARMSGVEVLRMVRGQMTGPPSM